jgi:hypothetical protein
LKPRAPGVFPIGRYIGVVELQGRVFEHEYGYRAEKMRVVKKWKCGTWNFRAKLRFAKALADRLNIEKGELR